MTEPIMLHSAFQSMIVRVMVINETSILLLAGTTGQKEVYGGQSSTRATFNTFRGCLRALACSLATVTTNKDVTFYATQRENSADALSCSAQTDGCALSWRVRTRTYGSALRVCARARRSGIFASGNISFNWSTPMFFIPPAQKLCHSRLLSSIQVERILDRVLSPLHLLLVHDNLCNLAVSLQRTPLS